MNNNDLIKQFGSKMGLPRLALGSEGTAALTVGADLEIVLEGEPDGGRLNINGKVGPLLSTESEFLRSLLMANHNGVATGGGAIAIDPRTSEIVLTWTLETGGQTLDQFAKTMENFARYLAFWVQYLPTIATAPATSELALGDEMNSFIRV